MQPQERQPPRERRPERRRVQHAGVLVPWANSVVEAELPRWAGTSVAWHHARLVPASLGTALAALGQLAALPLQRVYLACTSAAFVFPGQAQTATAGSRVPVVTAFDAILAALRQWHCDRIVLLTPYPAKVCEAEADTFASHGVAVTGHATLNLRDGYAAIDRGQIRDLARRADTRAVEEAQAIVLSCTGWPTWGLEKVLAQTYGKKVVSSNLAVATHALQAGGNG
jgi:maleate isomerase